MRFTVLWLRRAENELARIWTRATDHQAVSQAADRIDHLLKFSAHARGHDHPGVYQLTVLPLTVVFEVSPDDFKVTVLRVTYFGS